MQNIWQQLSNQISETVAQVGRSIVAVDGRSGHTSSGIVWKADSILTAAHSIRQETNIRLIAESGKSVRARLAGRASAMDIALLKIEEETGATPADFGTTNGLQVGQFVVATGRTRRGNIVASSGILSGVMAEWHAGRSRIDQFIRPDLTLYSGFSGGALTDAEGKILGMNTDSLLRGKPLTVPASTLIRIGEELSAKGQVTTPYIGIVTQPVTVPETIRQKSGLAMENGLLVMHVEPSGPADVGGVLLGDVLVNLEAQAFDSLDDFQDALGRRGVGEEVTALVIRGGQKVELKIRIGQRPVR